jgi:hypothetical protein
MKISPAYFMTVGFLSPPPSSTKVSLEDHCTKRSFVFHAEFIQEDAHVFFAPDIDDQGNVVFVIIVICTGLHNIQTNKYSNIQMAVYSERAALQKNKSSNDALALKARKRNITYA